MIALAPLNLVCLFLLTFSGLFLSYGKTHDEGSNSNLLELKGSVSDIYSPSSIVPCGKQKISGNHHGHKHRSVVYNETSIVFLAAAVIAILSIAGFLVYLAVYCFRRRSQHMEPVRTSSPIPQANEVTVFNDIGVPLTYEAVIQATDNFNRRNRIGRGGFGSIYKAEVAPGKIVAIKKLTASRHQGVPQFDAEVNILSSVNHPNLITLVGYYAFQDEMFLIYNYLPGGNLNQLIRARDRLPFNWDILHKIALDIASALSYLHEESNPRVLHRDIKPSNILLDNVYNAYLSDFGLAKMLPPGASSSITPVAGTYGYVAPEYASSGRVSNKADVYSYGVVLLELMSDKRVLDPLFSLREDGFNIVSWARVLRNERRVEEFFTASLWNMGPKDKLTGLLHVAVLCTAEFASGRPTMRSVIQLLEQLQHLAAG